MRAPWSRAAWAFVGALLVLLVVVVGLTSPSPQQAAPSTSTTPAPATTTVTSTTAPPATTAARPSTTAARPTTTRPATVPPAHPPTTARRPPPTTAPTPASLRTLRALPIRSVDWSRPYDRAADFGPAWTDDNNDLWGHNGCDTRNDILRRDLTGVGLRPGTHGCVVISGRLADPYGGTVITFVKANASAVQIDHVVPLRVVWGLGAWAWSPDRRVDYANDPDVLLAVSGPLNESKGDDLADQWLPPNTAYRCTFARRVVTIHAKYALPVTAPERAALEWVLSRC